MTADPDARAVRSLAFAGSWYDADPDRLAGQVDGLIASAERPAGRVTALLAPHAGLRYSGAVAACSYACLADSRPEVVVLVGPSHYAAFGGCGLLRSGSLTTPWDPLPVHTELAGLLARQSSLAAEERRPEHAQEHSLELQLPFLARVCPGVPVLPILMGEQTRRVTFALGDLLGELLAGRDAVLVASSDLSHYLDAQHAAALDAVVLRHVEAFDTEALMRALEREPGHACGGGPLVAVMRTAQRLGATRARVLRYADSGDVSGDKQRVVGYASAAFSTDGA
jgi:AmmeMemoRadiSam system protein B